MNYKYSHNAVRPTAIISTNEDKKQMFEVLKAQFFAFFSSPGVTVVCGGFPRLADVFEICGPEITISCGSLRQLPDMFAVSKDPFFAGFPCPRVTLLCGDFPLSDDFASGFGTLAPT